MELEIRLATGEDARDVREIYAPIVKDTMISFEWEPPSVDDLRRRIETTLTSLPWLAATEAGRLLGYAYAARHRSRAAYDWSVETSVYVRDGFRGRGVGRALYRSLFAVLALQGYYNAYAGIALPNEASVALHESLGFELVGVYSGVGFKMGRWHDVGWWQRVLREKDENPAPARSLREAQAFGGWAAALAAGRAAV